MKNNFLSEEEWRQQMLELVTMLVKAVKENKNITLEDFDLIDNAGLLRLFNITKKTAANWREQGLVRYAKIGGRIYYKRSDIREMVDKSFERE